MDVICFHYAKVLELPYTSEFVGIIDINNSSHGLRGDVIIESTKNDDRLVLGTCISKDATADEICECCLNLLSNEEYCMDVFSHRFEI